MAQYDGAIRINTNINTKDAKVQLSALQHTIVKTADEIVSLRSRMDAMRDVKTPTEAYEEMEKQLLNALNTLEELEEKQRSFPKEFSQMSADELAEQAKSAWEAFNRTTEELGQMDVKLSELENRMKVLRKEDGDPNGILPDVENEYNTLMSYYKELQDENSETLKQISMINDSVKISEKIKNAKESVEQLDDKLKELEDTGKGFKLGTDTEEYKNLAKQLQNEQKALAKMSLKFAGLGGLKLIGKAKDSFKKLGEIAKTAFSKINKSAGKSSGLLGTMASRFKGLALSLLIFNQISKAFNAMVSGIKQGFGNLYKEVGGFKSAVDELKASSLTLKNSFAAAFRPLVEIAIPYIQKAIEYMTMLADSFGQFMAVITGQKTYTKAIKQTTAALEEGKKAEQGYLSPLDEINKFQKKDSQSGSGGSTGTMFEEAPIDSGFKTMFDRLKEIIESKDWESLGSYIANGLNTGLQKIYDIINWDAVGTQITYFAEAVTTSFNSVVNSFDWGLLGQTIGAGINTVINTLSLFITGINWVELGKGLADGLNGLAGEVNFTNVGTLIGQKFMVLPSILLGVVSELDWSAIGISIGETLNGIVGAIDLSQIGEMLGKGLTGIFQAAIDFSSTFGWEALGTNIYQGINSFLSNVDFASVGQGISDFVMGILDALLIAVQGVNWAELGSSIVDFIVNIDWIGLAVKLLEIGVHLIGGLLEGMLVAISDIGRWLRENVFDPIVDWFKKLFGIHSPSTVMAEMGSFLMKGLFNGISSLVENVASIFGDLKQKIGDKWSEISTAAAQKWDEIKQNLSDRWNNLKEDAGDIFNKVRGNISDSWEKVKQNTSITWQGIKTTMQGAWSVLKTNSKTSADFVKTGVLSAWNLLKTGSSNIWDSVFGDIDDVLSSIKDVVQSVFGWIADMVGWIVEKIGSVFTKANEASKVSVPSKGGGSSGGKITRSAFESYSLPLPKETIAAINSIPIPRLATGAVIPANKEFLAVLGDQKHGTNIEAPLDTIKQAQKESILEILSELGLTGGSRDNYDRPIIIKQYLDGKQVAESVVKQGKIQQMSTGSNMFLLGTT